MGQKNGAFYLRPPSVKIVLMPSWIKKNIPKLFLFCSAFVVLAWIPASRVPTDPAEQKVFYLQQGRIYTEADYIQKDLVKGQILGLSFSPPQKVWQSFINGNKWNRRNIAKGIIESRIVSKEEAQKIAALDLKGNNDVYPIIGREKIPPDKHRRPHDKWETYWYFYFDFPWPVSDRWMVIVAKADETKSGSPTYRMDFDRVGGNIKFIKGFCEVKAFENDPKTTYFNYEATVDPGIHLPKIFIKWGVTRVLPAVLQAMRRETGGLPRPITSQTAWR